MLVLSRQKDESIIIGDDVEITIVDVRGDKVRLGINAPKSISVHRKEVYEAIQREKAEMQRQKEAPKVEAPQEEQIYYIKEELDSDIFDDGCDEEPSAMAETQLLDEMNASLQARKDEVNQLPDLPV